MADVESYSVTAASNTGLFPEGQAPSTVNDGGRQVQADVKIANNRINGDITAGGTADALTATFSPVHSAHVAGRVLVITAAAANATPTPTFTLDGLAAKTITKNGGQALVAGDIYGAGHELILKDAGTYYELMNPALPDLNGKELILDADADTSITADTDDQVDFRLGGTDIIRFKTVVSAVNGLDFIGTATGVGVNITAQGTDSNISIISTPKGTGEAYSTTVSANEVIKHRVFS